MRHFFFCFFVSLASLAYSQSVYNIQYSEMQTPTTIKTGVIDSITFTQEGDELIQNIWCGGLIYSNSTSQVDTIRIIESTNESSYTSNDDSTFCAIMTNNGDYCALYHDTLTNKNLVILGNKMSSNEDFFTFDSLGLITAFSVDDNVYSLLYGRDSLVIYHKDSFLLTVPYENFLSNISSLSSMRAPASVLTRNPFYQSLSIFSKILGYINKPAKSFLKDVLKSQMGGDHDGWLEWIIDNFDGLDFLGKIKALDMILDGYYFANASITTLEPNEISVCNYDLGCNVYLPSRSSAFYIENAFRGVSMDFRIFMHVWSAFGRSYDTEKTRTPLVDEEYWFNFNNLEAHTMYHYEPRLTVEYSISDKAYWLGIGVDPNKVGPRKVKKSIYGEVGTFTTPRPSCSVISAHDITCTSAKISSAFYDVPENAECSAIVFDNKNNSRKFVASGTKDTVVINITGLTPGTRYSYQACITYKDETFMSNNTKNFTTLYPSVSTGNATNITSSSAEIKATFTNVSGVECGIVLSDENGERKITGSSVDGQQVFSVSGLNPCTSYTYWAYAQIGEEIVNGSVKYFSAGVPDISGTWSVVETDSNNHTKSYTLTLNSDGTMTVSGLGTNYIDTPSWSYSCSGEFHASATVLSTSTQWTGESFSGYVDNLQNPTRITGSRITERWNQYGSFSSFQGSIIMTR